VTGLAAAWPLLGPRKPCPADPIRGPAHTGPAAGSRQRQRSSAHGGAASQALRLCHRRWACMHDQSRVAGVAHEFVAQLVSRPVKRPAHPLSVVACWRRGGIPATKDTGYLKVAKDVFAGTCGALSARAACIRCRCRPLPRRRLTQCTLLRRRHRCHASRPSLRHRQSQASDAVSAQSDILCALSRLLGSSPALIRRCKQDSALRLTELGCGTSSGRLRCGAEDCSVGGPAGAL